MDLKQSPILLQWYHFCLKVDTVSGQISFAVNGRFIHENIFPMLENTLSTKKPKTLQNKLELGRYVDYGKKKQYSWKLSNFNIFYGNKSHDDLVDITGNLCDVDGDYLAWKDMIWLKTGEGAKLLELSKKELCTRSIKRQIALPVKLNFKMANQVCLKIGRKGIIPIGNKTDMAKYIGFIERNLPEPHQIWTSYTDQNVEGTFLDVNSGKPCAFYAWGTNQPNGGEQQNCLSLVPG